MPTTRLPVCWKGSSLVRWATTVWASWPTIRAWKLSPPHWRVPLGASLADVLAIFAEKWPPTAPEGWLRSYPNRPWKSSFTPSDVARLSNRTSDFAEESIKEEVATILSVFFPNLKPKRDVDARAVTKRLKPHLNEPVRHGSQTLILRGAPNTHTLRYEFYLEMKSDDQS